MPIINQNKKEVQFKIVYCGTGLSGKTSNLAHVHNKLNEEHRGDLVSLATSTDRTLFFDFLPINAMKINGYQTKFQLYTVPGQAVYNTTRQLVLRGVDGLVFVVDSQLNRMTENVEAFRTMQKNLLINGVRLENTPLVLQYNKRDLQEKAPLNYLQYIFNSHPNNPFPFHEAIASEGQNVFQTLDTISQAVLKKFYQPNPQATPPVRQTSPPSVAGGEQQRQNQPQMLASTNA